MCLVYFLKRIPIVEYCQAKNSIKVEHILIETNIKNKIKYLLNEKKVKITSFSLKIGYSRSFLSTILTTEEKFFNLEHIEKICNALNYPVWKLFKEESQEEKEKANVLEAKALSLENVTDSLKKALAEIESLSNLLGFQKKMTKCII